MRKTLKKTHHPFFFPKFHFEVFPEFTRKGQKQFFKNKTTKITPNEPSQKHSTAVMSSLSVERQKSKQKGRKIMCVCVCATRSTD